MEHPLNSVTLGLGIYSIICGVYLVNSVAARYEEMGLPNEPKHILVVLTLSDKALKFL